MLTATQSAAFAAFLATLTSEQRTSLLNVTSMHIENEETKDEDVAGDNEETLASDGHIFIVAIRDAVILDLG